jgi:hypothetical protein
MSNRFPHLLMSDGKRFYFGQNLAEAEEMFGALAKQHPPEIARYVPQQKTIETSGLILTFDAGRLMRMEFLQDFSFQVPLAPYPENWKNFDSFDFAKTANEMTRKDVVESLAAWEIRAQRSGARKIEPGDLATNEYYTYSDEEEFWNVIGINIGKSRRAGGGGLWMDGWIINFTTARDAELNQVAPGIFRSVSAFCDEFNTAARK